MPNKPSDPRAIIEASFRNILQALGCELEGELADAPARAAALWADDLL
ncbi:MAG: hypothetical protein R3C68_18770 [Myxococcota bacterium]